MRWKILLSIAIIYSLSAIPNKADAISFTTNYIGGNVPDYGYHQAEYAPIHTQGAWLLPTNDFLSGRIQQTSELSFNYATDIWGHAFGDDTNFTINWGWSDLGGPDSDGHMTLAETDFSDSTITLNNQYDFFYFDGDPGSSWEYGTLNASYLSNGISSSGYIDGYLYNVSPYGNNDYSNLESTVDLFSVVLHEIGHILGMSGQNSAYNWEVLYEFENEIDLTGPRDLLDGFDIPMVSGSAHIDLPDVIMKPSITLGHRGLLTGYDILAIAQLNDFTDLYFPEYQISDWRFDTYSWKQITPVPEPATILLVATGLIGLAGFRKKFKK